MQPAKNCETCGKPVAADAPSGMCPSCLLRTAIEYGSSHALAPMLPRLRFFGDYELLEEVARGGQGVVYRARQVSLDRIVAIKMMQPGLLATEAEIGRFRAEARTAAKLQHPNIVAIHEVGEFDGLHYFSMDFVEGPNLAEVIRQGAVSSEEAARYLLILAETVEYAHAKGVLHRDLKPSNVLLDGAGRPRVTDFGLARPLHGEADGAAAGTVTGTPAYMPPEQAAGRNDRLSAASDVYSLGAILYELLTGRPPFHGASQMETVRMVLEQEPVPPRELNPSVNRLLEAICLRCLAKEPADRCQTAAELAGYLRRILRTKPVALKPFRRHLVLPGAAILAVLAILAVVFVTLRTKPSTPVRPARSALGTETASPRPSPVTPAPASVSKAETAVAEASKAKPAPVHGAVPATIPAAIPAANSADITAAIDAAFAPKPVPVAVSVSPERGAGYRQEFTFRYSHPRGAAAIQTAEVDFHETGGEGARRCAILVVPDENRVRLQFYPDRAPGLTVPGVLGALAVLENSVCSVDLTGVSVKLEGNDLELRLTVAFKPSFDGPKEIGSWPWSKSGVRGESHVQGEWVVGNKPAAPL